MNRRKYTGVVLMSLLLFGCATVSEGPAYSSATAAPDREGYAILYVFREYAEPTLWGATIHIDGEKLATLKQGEFSQVYATPGERVVTGVWPAISAQRESKITLDLLAGKEYFVELTGISRVSGVSTVRVGSGLYGIDPEAAKTRLMHCCTFNPAIAQTY